MCCHHGGPGQLVEGGQLGTEDGTSFALFVPGACYSVVKRNLASALAPAREPTPAPVELYLSWRCVAEWCKGRNVATNGGMIFDALKAGRVLVHRAETS